MSKEKGTMSKSRKRDIEKLDGKQRSVSFTKRRYGLFNKAAELFMLCDAQLAVLVSSPCVKPKRKIYSFGHPTVDVVLDAYLNDRVPDPIDNGVKQFALSLLNDIKGLEGELMSTVERNKRLKNGENGFSSIFEGFENSESIEELEAVVNSVEKLLVKAKSKINSPISCIPSNENENIINDGFCNVPNNNNNAPSTSKSAGDDDLLLFQDSTFGYNFDSDLVLPVDHVSASCFNYNEKGKGKLDDCNTITDPAPNYDFGCVNIDYGNNVGATSNSKQHENWSLTNCSTSSNYFGLSDDMAANQFSNQFPLDFGAAGTLDSTLPNFPNDVYEDSVYFDDLWS